MKYVLVLCLSLLNICNAWTQSDALLWQKITLRHALPTNLSFLHEFHARQPIRTGQLSLAIYRPWIVKKYSSIHSVQFSPIAYLYRNLNGAVNSEWRSSMMSEWNLQCGKLTWLNRLGVEGRLMGRETHARVRGRLGIKWLFKKSSVTLSDEALINTSLHKHTFQNWLHGQWDLHIYQKHKLQIGVQCVNENKRYKNTIFFTGLGFNL